MPAAPLVVRPKSVRKPAGGSCLLQFMIVITLVSAFAVLGVAINSIDMSNFLGTLANRAATSVFTAMPPAAGVSSTVVSSTPTVSPTLQVNTPPHVEETSKVEYYRVRAGNEAEIQATLFNGGPQIDGAGEHAIATTQYNLSATWQMGQYLSRCEISDIVVHLDLIFTYPKWEPPVTPPNAKLQSEWDRFYDHVVEHEEHHAQIARECAGTLAHTLQTIDAGTTCTDSKSQVDKIINDIYAQCEEQQKSFDDAEGRTSFPLPWKVEQPARAKTLLLAVSDYPFQFPYKTINVLLDWACEPVGLTRNSPLADWHACHSLI